MGKRIVFLDMPKTRVYLSPVEKSDIVFFRRALNNENITKFLRRHDPVMDIEEEQWFENLPKKKETDRVCSIILKKTHEVIGSIGLHNINSVDRTASTGTFIGREDLWGQGLGTEAKMLWLKYSFLTLNLRMIISRAYSFNGRSVRYSEKCGYEQIAIYPDFVFSEGSYHNLIHLMVTREMWEPKWKEFEERMKGD